MILHHLPFGELRVMQEDGSSGAAPSEVVDGEQHGMQ